MSTTTKLLVEMLYDTCEAFADLEVDHEDLKTNFDLALENLERMADRDQLEIKALREANKNQAELIQSLEVELARVYDLVPASTLEPIETDRVFVLSADNNKQEFVHVPFGCGVGGDFCEVEANPADFHEAAEVVPEPVFVAIGDANTLPNGVIVGHDVDGATWGRADDDGTWDSPAVHSGGGSSDLFDSEFFEGIEYVVVLNPEVLGDFQPVLA